MAGADGGAGGREIYRREGLRGFQRDRTSRGVFSTLLDALSSRHGEVLMLEGK